MTEEDYDNFGNFMGKFSLEHTTELYLANLTAKGKKALNFSEISFPKIRRKC